MGVIANNQLPNPRSWSHGKFPLYLIIIFLSFALTYKPLVYFELSMVQRMV
jgi:hypothetical protein